jgi:hypothetical protein
MRYSEKSKKYFQWIIFLFLFLFISASFLPYLIILFISIFFLIKLVKNVEYHFLRNNIFYFLITFCFYININSFFLYKTYISFETSISYIRFILFAFFLSYYFNLRLKKIINLSFLSCYVIFYLYQALLINISNRNFQK